jgi:hypothetical protein
VRSVPVRFDRSSPPENSGNCHHRYYTFLADSHTGDGNRLADTDRYRSQASFLADNSARSRQWQKWRKKPELADIVLRNLSHRVDDCVFALAFRKLIRFIFPN